MAFHKIFLVSLFLCFAALPCLPEERHFIETDQGTVEVVLPDGMTYEDAFLEMARLFYNERYANDRLNDMLKKLVADANAYKAQVDELLRLQGIPRFGVGLYLSENPFALGLPTIYATGSVLFGRTISIEAFISTKLDLGLGVSYFF